MWSRTGQEGELDPGPGSFGAAATGRRVSAGLRQGLPYSRQATAELARQEAVVTSSRAAGPSGKSSLTIRDAATQLIPLLVSLSLQPAIAEYMADGARPEPDVMTCLRSSALA